MEMIYTLPLTQTSWMDIVDHYFDHVHWIGDDRNEQYNTPADWLWNTYGAVADMERRVYIFNNEKDRNWFQLKWS
jgi:hypothetical protein